MKLAGSVGDILRQKGARIISIAPDATVFDAVKLLAEHNIGALPVLQAGRMVGIFTERDYSRKIVLVGKSSKATQVAEVMSPQPVLIEMDHSIEDCMEIMTDKRVRHLPVIQGGQLVGLVSIGDLVKWIISAQSAALDQMEQYISGSYPG
jgi:CBS domain-containing protein